MWTRDYILLRTDTYTVIYPDASSVWLNSQNPHKKTMGNDFVPCSEKFYLMIKSFSNLKYPIITLIEPKSP